MELQVCAPEGFLEEGAREQLPCMVNIQQGRCGFPCWAGLVRWAEWPLPFGQSPFPMLSCQGRFLPTFLLIGSALQKPRARTPRGVPYLAVPLVLAASNYAGHYCSQSLATSGAVGAADGSAPCLPATVLILPLLCTPGLPQEPESTLDVSLA